MTMPMNYAGMAGLALLLGVVQGGCGPRAPANQDVGAARVDTMAAPKPDTSAATPPITPASVVTSRDTPPSAAATPSAKPAADGGAKPGKLEYEGWRQYSVNCARCHGQDVLPNPVAANLLISLAPGGPMDSEQKFVQVVAEGRPDKGMPGFKSTLAPDEIKAIYAYVKGRAEKRIPPGRPERPA